MYSFNPHKKCATNDFFIQFKESLLLNHNSSNTAAILTLIGFFISGCGNSDSENAGTSETKFESVKPTVDPDTIVDEDKMLTADELREALGANENAHFEKVGKKFTVALLTNTGAKTLEPLKGQPLKILDISQTRISDLSAVEGMLLENIGLAETKVTDLTPLKGMQLKHIDGTRSEVSDISALEGMTQLAHVYFEGAKVKDISPLKSAPLKVLWLNGCPVEDLSPLEGKQLDELNLCDTALENLNTVKTMKLGTLWMRNTKVQDLAPIAEHGLVSLDVQGSSINDLSSLVKMTSLKRLNISQTDVTDLTPLGKLELNRLIFSPEKITAGIDVVRNMTSLQALDTSFEGTSQPMSPSEFWERYDAGDFKAETE